MKAKHDKKEQEMKDKQKRKEEREKKKLEKLVKATKNRKLISTCSSVDNPKHVSTDDEMDIDMESYDNTCQGCLGDEDWQEGRKWIGCDKCARWFHRSCLAGDVEQMTDEEIQNYHLICTCLLYTSPSPRDKRQSRMPSSA